MPLDIVVLAAGAGRRLYSQTPKPLQQVGGRSLLAHVLAAVAPLPARRLVVVVPPEPAVGDAVCALNPKAICAVQPQARGTADALRCALPYLNSKQKTAQTLIVCADTPLITTATLRRLYRNNTKPAVRLLTFTADDPRGYGRIVRDNKNTITAIVEQRDATATQKRIGEVYAGMMSAPAHLLRTLLAKVGTQNAAGERYLTDIVSLARRAGVAVSAHNGMAVECTGVNTAADLEQCERAYQHTVAVQLLARGVRLADRTRLTVRGTVRAGRDVAIDADVVLEGEVVLATGSCIGGHCVIRNSRIGAGSSIAPFSHLDGARIGKRCVVGPFARLRPAAVVGDGGKVGNFVEVKNSQLAAGVRAGHLSYIGDAHIGRGTNIGAGTITCNYDGRAKHATIIEDDVFIGSGTQLVAPVRVRRGAVVGAGSVITKPVPAGALAVARGVQKNIARKKRAGTKTRGNKNARR